MGWGWGVFGGLYFCGRWAVGGGLWAVFRLFFPVLDLFLILSPSPSPGLALVFSLVTDSKTIAVIAIAIAIAIEPQIPAWCGLVDEGVLSWFACLFSTAMFRLRERSREGEGVNRIGPTKVATRFSVWTRAQAGLLGIKNYELRIKRQTTRRSRRDRPTKLHSLPPTALQLLRSSNLRTQSRITNQA